MNAMQHAIVADIGGTNARFALSAGNSPELQQIRTLACADYPTLLDALRHYLQTLEGTVTVDGLCMAVAAPIESDFIRMTNNDWSFSKQQLQESLGFSVTVLNDFSAQLLSIPTLQESELQWLGEPRPAEKQVIAALGPGTGLGVAGLTVGGEIIPSEGGHLAFAPLDRHEVDLLEQLWKVYPRVSVERILSGPGLAALHQANAVLAGADTDARRAEQITAGARAGDSLCLQSVQDFIAILGSVAGDLALGLGSRGGVYLCGGVLAHLDGLYPVQLLRERFNDKGRFTAYCSDIPLALVRAEHTGLRGCAHALRHDYC